MSSVTPTPGPVRQSSRTSTKQPVDYRPHVRYPRRYKRHSTASSLISSSSLTDTNSSSDQQMKEHQSSVPVRGEEVEMKDASIMMDLLSSHPCVDHETAADVQEEREEETVQSKKRKSTASTHIDQDEIETDTDDSDDDSGGCDNPLRKRVNRTCPTWSSNDPFSHSIPRSSHENEETKEQPTSAAAAITASTNRDQVMMEDEDEAKEFEQKKRSSVVSRPMVKCPTCEKVCPMSQMRVLPCTRIICRSCGIKKVSENKQQSTMYCRDCGDDHILARSNEVMTAGDVIDRCPTMKQSQQRLALASHESDQRRPLCSYSDCDELAGYLCPDGCGHLCEDHKKIVHEYHPGHHPISLDEVEKKKAVMRLEETKVARAALDAQLKQLADDGQLKLEYDLAINKCIAKIDSQIKTIVDFFAHEGPQIINDLHKLKQAINVSCKQANHERHLIIHQLQERASRLQGISIETALTIPDAIGPSLTKESRQQLETFLKMSGKSLNNPRLLYKSTRDGWHKDAFISRCQGKSDTLVLVKVAAPAVENDRSYIFGAYIAPAWPGTGENTIVSDELNESFIFSLTNPSAHPHRLSLTKPDPSVAVVAVAVDLSAEGGGIVFGQEDDSEKWANMILFYDGRPANHPHGLCINDQNDATYAYQLDEAASKPSTGFVLDAETFCGRHFCGASEIEVCQLE